MGLLHRKFAGESRCLGRINRAPCRNLIVVHIDGTYAKGHDIPETHPDSLGDLVINEVTKTLQWGKNFRRTREPIRHI